MANLSHLPELWRQSGLTQREFCEQEGIKVPTFAYWRAKELDAQRQSSPSPSPSASTQAFKEVRVAAQVAPLPVIEITYPDGTLVRIPLPATSAQGYTSAL